MICQNEDTEEDGETDAAPEDYLYNYHRCKLAFGLILFEFNDAIKEGDGERLFDLYKMALLLYKFGGHVKYSYVVLLYLVKIVAILPEFDAHQLKWNRFCNKHGSKGHNIPLDLRMEQLNKQLKTLLRALGANLTESSAQRLAQSLELLEMLMSSIDKDCSLTARVGYRSQGKPEETVKQIVGDLMQKDVFSYHSGRDGHPSFPEFESNLLHGLDYRDLHEWMSDLLHTWESVYERDV